MRESKFIELLNLYIDGEIAPQDAAELELAIQKNRRFRQIYGQYCRIHRATVLLSESFRKDSQIDFSREPDTEVLLRRSGRHFFRTQFGPAIGGLAAAFAVVFGGYVYFRQSSRTVQTSPVAQTPASAQVASMNMRSSSVGNTGASQDFVSFSAPIDYYDMKPAPNGTLIRASYRPTALRVPQTIQNAFAQDQWPAEEQQLWSPSVVNLYGPGTTNLDPSQNRFYSDTSNYHSPKLQTVSFDFQK